MHRYDDDAFTEKPRLTSNAARRLRVRKLLSQIAWLDAPRVICSGDVWALPDRAAVREGLRAAPERTRATLKKLARACGMRVDRRLLGLSNRALLEVTTAKKLAEESVVQIGDLDAFRRRAEAHLREVTILLSEPERAEAYAIWLDDDASRPSHGAPPEALYARAAERLTPLPKRARLPKALRGWSLDLLACYGATLGSLEALAATAARFDGARFQETLAIGACLLARDERSGLLDAIALVDRAVSDSELTLVARRQRFVPLFERAAAAALASEPQRLVTQLSECIAAELLHEGAPHAAQLPERANPFDTLSDAARWCIGSPLSLPKDPPRTVKSPLAIVDRLRAAAVATLARGPALRADRRDELAGLLASVCEEDLPGAAAGLAGWIAHATAACSAGPSGDEPLRLARDVIVRSIQGGARAEPLLHHLAASGAAFLDQARILAAEDGLALLARTYLRSMQDSDDGPIMLSLLGAVPMTCAIDHLTIRGTFLDLWRILRGNEARKVAVMTWLAERPKAFEAIRVWGMVALRRFVNDASDRAFTAILRVTREIAAAHDDETMAVRCVFEVVNWIDALDDAMAERAAWIRLIAEDVLASPARFADELTIEQCVSNRGPVIDLAVDWLAAGYTAVRPLFHQRMKIARDAEQRGRTVSHPHTPHELRLAAWLSEGDPARLNALIAHTHLDWGESEPAWNGYEVARRSPSARKTIHDFARDPSHLPMVYRALQSLALVQKLLHQRQIDRLFGRLDAAPNATAPLDGVPAKWLLQTHALLHHLSIAGEPAQLPGTLQRLIDRVASWREELQHLEARPQTPSSQKRLLALRARLATRESVDASLEEDYGKALLKLTAHARFRAFTRLIQEALASHWRRLLGESPKQPEHPDWQNALHLLLSVESNRRLLKQLLRARVTGTVAVFRDHASNQRFMQTLSAAEQRAWLQPRSLVMPVAKSRLRAYVEQDPLRVLQMGNLFATCLSLGGVNAFSTIANAAEINKRVLMLEDEGQTIVGRKLIALSKDRVLYGFRSYGSSLQYRQGGAPWAKIAFDLLSLQLAHATGTRFPTVEEDERATNEAGTSELRLFADWYNDGTERFDFWVGECGREGGGDAALVEQRLREELAAPVDLEATLRGLVWLGERGTMIAAEFLERGKLDATMAAWVARHATAFDHVRVEATFGDGKMKGRSRKRARKKITRRE